MADVDLKQATVSAREIRANDVMVGFDPVETTDEDAPRTDTVDELSKKFFGLLKPAKVAAAQWGTNLNVDFYVASTTGVDRFLWNGSAPSGTNSAQADYHIPQHARYLHIELDGTSVEGVLIVADWRIASVRTGVYLLLEGAVGNLTQTANRLTTVNINGIERTFNQVATNNPPTFTFRETGGSNFLGANAYFGWLQVNANNNAEVTALRNAFVVKYDEVNGLPFADIDIELDGSRTIAVESAYDVLLTEARQAGTGLSRVGNTLNVDNPFTDDDETKLDGLFNGIPRNVQTSNYTILASDEGRLVTYSGATNATFSLPNILDGTDVEAGFSFWVANEPLIGNPNLSLDGNGSDTIEGLTSFNVPVGQTFLLQADTSASWRIRARSIIGFTRIIDYNTSGTVTQATFESWDRAIVRIDGNSGDIIVVTGQGLTRYGYDGMRLRIEREDNTTNEVNVDGTQLRYSGQYIDLIRIGNEWEEFPGPLQPDYNETSRSSPAFIRNKPTIAAPDTVNKAALTDDAEDFVAAQNPILDNWQGISNPVGTGASFSRITSQTLGTVSRNSTPGSTTTRVWHNNGILNTAQRVGLGVRVGTEWRAISAVSNAGWFEVTPALSTAPASGTNLTLSPWNPVDFYWSVQHGDVGNADKAGIYLDNASIEWKKFVVNIDIEIPFGNPGNGSTGIVIGGNQENAPTWIGSFTEGFGFWVNRVSANGNLMLALRSSRVTGSTQTSKYFNNAASITAFNGASHDNWSVVNGAIRFVFPSADVRKVLQVASTGRYLYFLLNGVHYFTIDLPEDWRDAIDHFGPRLAFMGDDGLDRNIRLFGLSFGTPDPLHLGPSLDFHELPPLPAGAGNYQITRAANGMITFSTVPAIPPPQGLTGITAEKWHLMRNCPDIITPVSPETLYPTAGDGRRNHGDRRVLTWNHASALYDSDDEDPFTINWITGSPSGIDVPVTAGERGAFTLSAGGTYQIGIKSLYEGNVPNNGLDQPLLKRIIAGTPVTNLVLTANGSGYTSPPIIGFEAGGGGTGAAATAVLSGGAVTAITITTAGSGYTSPPTITIADTGSGTGAAATATINATTGALTAINVTNGGSGYLGSTVSVTIAAPPPKATATGSANTNASGEVSAVSRTSGGSGYTPPPRVTITGGNGTGATAQASVRGNAVISIQITSGGSGYTSAPTITIDGPPGSGTTATATATVASGAVDAITITSGGTGYVSPTVTLTATPGTGATFEATVNPNGEVAALHITNAGSGYTAGSTLNLTIQAPTPGVQAAANITVAPSSVARVTLDSGGSGYTQSPRITFTGGGGTGAAAMASASIDPIRLTGTDDRSMSHPFTVATTDQFYIEAGRGNSPLNALATWRYAAALIVIKRAA